MKEVRYTHQTITDPNGSGTYLMGILIITGLITLSLIPLGALYLLTRWLF